MHSYLRAVGFSNINKRSDLDKILGIIMESPTEKYVVKKKDKIVETELSKNFAERMGVTLRGEYDEKGFFHLEHYFPHFRGQTVSTKEEVIINKRIDTDAYTGMCDDMRLGVSLIFYLQNVIDYMDNKNVNRTTVVPVPVTLSGLSTYGKIILPLDKRERKNQNKASEAKQRSQLIAEAKKGNQDAIDSLTIDDIDLYAMISRRAKYEDVYSIVESSFIPYGSESDNYSIVATILEWSKVQNELTDEFLYDLFLECNDLCFNVCINEKDLIGEPSVGRRFKGNIWLQGMIHFVE